MSFPATGKLEFEEDGERGAESEDMCRSWGSRLMSFSAERKPTMENDSWEHSYPWFLDEPKRRLHLPVAGLETDPDLGSCAVSTLHTHIHAGCLTFIVSKSAGQGVSVRSPEHFLKTSEQRFSPGVWDKLSSVCSEGSGTIKVSFRVKIRRNSSQNGKVSLSFLDGRSLLFLCKNPKR